MCATRHLRTLGMQMRSESEIITGIAESLTKRAAISVNLSFRVFLAIVARPCLAAARAREDSRPLRTFDAHTRPIIESQVSGRRDK